MTTIEAVENDNAKLTVTALLRAVAGWQRNLCFDRPTIKYKNSTREALAELLALLGSPATAEDVDAILTRAYVGEV